MSELAVGQLKGLLVNSNKITVPSEHVLYAPGHVIQVVDTTLTGRYAQSLNLSTPTDIASFNCSITPKSATSKILVMVRWFGEFTPNGSTFNSVWGLKRNGTRVGDATDPGATVTYAITSTVTSLDNDANSTPEVMNFTHIDSPNSTSAVTYQVFCLQDQPSATLYTNRVVGWSGQTGGYELGTSSIILMEVAQ